MKVERLIVGNLYENCYILIKNDDVIIIDPGDNFKLIEKSIDGRRVSCILITHSHFDHIGALDDLIKKYRPLVLDYSNLKEKEYLIDGFKFEVIFTPGHSKDSVSYYFKKERIMFVGDFIFKEGIGRCDLDGGDFKEMLNSIYKIKKYSDCTIYPGHGESTTLKYEKVNNEYFNI